MVTGNPIVVTGTHRSGTTWVGHMLALGLDGHYIHEPFAGMNPRTWLTTPIATRFLHLEPGTASGADGPSDEDLQRLVGLRPDVVAMAKRSGGPRGFLRVAEQAGSAARSRRRGARAIIKDPFALLLAEWIQPRIDALMIVLVRHPAAFVSSVKRLRWRLDSRWLLGQQALMEGDLRPFRQELEDDDGLDLVDHGCLVWRALNSVVARLDDDHPDWTVMRYEDLALAPVAEFRHLYDALGLMWTDEVATQIEIRNSADNPSEVQRRSRGGTSRDSRSAIWTWRDRLTPDEIARIRDTTADVAAQWYGDAEWWDQ